MKNTKGLLFLCAAIPFGLLVSGCTIGADDSSISMAEEHAAVAIEEPAPAPAPVAEIAPEPAPAVEAEATVVPPPPPKQDRN